MLDGSLFVDGVELNADNFMGKDEAETKRADESTNYSNYNV